jgi:hypothetical protein
MCLFAMNQLIGTRRTMPPDATGDYRVERVAVACIHTHDILSAYSDHCSDPWSGASTPSRRLHGVERIMAVSRGTFT